MWRVHPTRERGRPARMHPHCVLLSFPGMGHPATLPAGTAWAGPKQSPGAVAGRVGWRRWARLCQDVCGRDARAPGGLHSVTSLQQGRSIDLSDHAWFVFNNDRQFLPRIICRRSRAGRRRLMRRGVVAGVSSCSGAEIRRTAARFRLPSGRWFRRPAPGTRNPGPTGCW